MRIVVFLLVAAMLVAGCSGNEKPATSGGTDVPTIPPKDIEFQDEEDVDVEDEGCGSPETGVLLTVREPGGFALAGYPVSLLGTEHSGTTNSDGQVRFVNVTPGQHVARVIPQDEWYKVTQAKIMIPAGCMPQATVTMPLKDGYLTPPHVHDAWKGRQSFELFSMEIDVDCVYGPSLSRCFQDDGMHPPRIAFPEPVPAGTGWLNITADFDATGPAAYINLQINRPGATGASYRLDAGVPVTFVEDRTELSDTPHSTSSRWTFTFGGYQPATSTPVHVEGPITLRVDVARSHRPLTIDPPHPDYWGNRTEVTLTDKEFSWGATQVYHNQNVPASELHKFDEGRLVFPGTREVVFTAWVNETVDRDQTIELWYAMKTDSRSEPDGRDYRRVPESTSDGVRYEWRVEVAEHEYDNLYLANETLFDHEEGVFRTMNDVSKWRFHFRTVSLSQDVYLAVPGEADVHVVAKAFR